jgi:hypothetical protein
MVAYPMDYSYKNLMTTTQKENKEVFGIIIAQFVVLGNPDPNHNLVTLREHLPIVTLDKYSHQFRDEVINSRGESRVTLREM